jgi:hypothetical protein
MVKMRHKQPKESRFQPMEPRPQIEESRFQPMEPRPQIEEPLQIISKPTYSPEFYEFYERRMLNKDAIEEEYNKSNYTLIMNYLHEFFYVHR